MKLESFQIEHKTTGEKKNIIGEKPNGYFIFTPQKRMMALLKTEGRKQPNTDEDRIAAFWSMDAYSGIYRVEGDKWTTKVDIARTETWTRSDEIRFFKLEEDKLSMDLGTRRLPEGGDYVFRGADGHQPPQKADRWFPRAVTKACHRLTEAGRQADVQMPKGFTWHCLRHTIASRLAMAGVDLLVIKELGGWKTLAMVTRYAHLSPGRLREGIERLTVAADSQSGPLPAASTMGSTIEAPAVIQTPRELCEKLVPPGSFDDLWGAEVRGIAYGGRLNAIRRAKIVGGRIIRLPFPSSVDVRAEIAAIMQCPSRRAHRPRGGVLLSSAVQATVPRPTSSRLFLFDDFKGSLAFNVPVDRNLDPPSSQRHCA